MKKTVLIAMGSALFLASGCGGNQRNVKTQEERLQEQLALADEQIAEQEEHDSTLEGVESDSEKAAKFDKELAKHELKRASLNAADCPNTFEKAQLEGYQPGTAEMDITFLPDGTVKDVSLRAPYDGTNVGDCVLRAMNSVLVRPFSGDEVTVPWTVELKEAKPTEAKDPKKK